MKKLLALAVLFFGMAGSAQAVVQYYPISNNTPDFDGQAYCSTVWPGSTFFGFRMGDASYHYIACQK
ncbi:hypothetical protein N8I74_04910 [Chitiniphilus purpureus]|uniref:Uncharacterized protein n=1 Tax=Chitiniphilus purpureus TaxID=2981137 RepID=A0ABY6DWY5_9NEIS|nr:hypothetical protein [Chitiniphilus sp. CD1]UXY16363.1 hypothetical protein N8I74_04910 [Chitiniphilus sp. CD1]